MRIACIHIPQYALQCVTRFDPPLRWTAAVVVGTLTPQIAGPHHAPVVIGCSRAAWHLGVRLGMTATAARSMAPSASIVGGEPALERETARAVAEALLGLSPNVDLGSRVGAARAHLALYAEVPSNVRGASFGNRALERLGALGVTCRIGIADDRFTAWVAASHGGVPTGPEHRGSDVVVVPRGGSAAFLAPLPLTLLQISIEVQHMLEALGVHTLGEFAALPSPSIDLRTPSTGVLRTPAEPGMSIAPRPQVFEVDYQALARGDSGTRLRSYVPQGAICEDIVVSAGNVLDGADSVSGPTAVAHLARRIALRLEGRGSVATRLRISASPGAHTRDVDLPAHGVIPVQGGGEVVEVELDNPGSVPRQGFPRVTGVRPSSPVGDFQGSSGISQGHSTPDEGVRRWIDSPMVEPEQLARAMLPIAAGSMKEPWTLRVVVVGERPSTALVQNGQLSADVHSGPASAAAESTVHPLALVLSTPGALFAMSSPKQRLHRRTRRSKQRRVLVRPTASQPTLFERG